jgi:hypothetical protein
MNDQGAASQPLLRLERDNRKRLTNTPCEGAGPVLNGRMNGEPKAVLRGRRTRAEVQQLVSEFPAAACGGMNSAAVEV